MPQIHDSYGTTEVGAISRNGFVDTDNVDIELRDVPEVGTNASNTGTIDSFWSLAQNSRFCTMCTRTGALTPSKQLG